MACGCVLGWPPKRVLAAAQKTTLTADQALAILQKGNDDFVNERPKAQEAGPSRRAALTGGQAPFAVIVGCSDSRVPPELIFGQGLGDIFIVRVAGNSVDRTGLGTIEYGVAELGCPLVVVLGHERCGAVTAALKVVSEDLALPGAIAEMVAPIIPAVLKAQRMQGDLLTNAVKEHARHVARRLREDDEILSDPVRQGRVKIVAAYYNLTDGSVDIL